MENRGICEDRDVGGTNMTIFEFSEKSPALLGRVVAVDTRRVTLNVEPARLSHAHVGKLVAIRTSNPVEEWLIAMVDRVQRALAEPERKIGFDVIKSADELPGTLLEREINSVVDRKRAAHRHR